MENWGRLAWLLLTSCCDRYCSVTSVLALCDIPSVCTTSTVTRLIVSIHLRHRLKDGPLSMFLVQKFGDCCVLAESTALIKSANT
jgi:hypothetical protein